MRLLPGMRLCIAILGWASAALAGCDAEPPAAPPPSPVVEHAVPRVGMVPERPVITPSLVVVLGAAGPSVPGQPVVAWEGAGVLIGELFDRERERALAEQRPPELRLEIVADPELDMTRISQVVQIASNVGFEEATLAVQTDATRTRLAIALAKMCRPVALAPSSFGEVDDRCEATATFVTARGTYQHLVVGAPSHCDPATASRVLGGAPATVATLGIPEGSCPAVARHQADECPYVFAGAGPGVTWGAFAPALAAIAVHEQRRPGRAIVLTGTAVGSLGCDARATGETLGLIGTVRRDDPQVRSTSLENVGRPPATR